MTFQQLVDLLQCPHCSSALSYRPVEAPAGHGHYGILTCKCRRYPVIDGIPILMSGRVGIISHWNDGAVHLGPTAAELVSALERGGQIDALIDCLIFPRTFRGQARLARAGLWPGSLGKRAGLALTRANLRSLLSRPPGELFAEDLFGFFYSRRSGQNTFLIDYFTNRFVMPRYLSSMSLVQRLPKSEKPVLDIACGFGHFEHYLTRRSRRTPAIGTDFNFYQLWGAKRCVAPDAQFVCCDAGDPLPFRDDAFSGSVCSDAFMLMPDKLKLTREIERVAPGRPAIYARVGNLDVGPPNPPGGGELRPSEYRDLFGASQCRYFADSSLWKAYLDRRNPLAEEPVDIASLRWEKYLSFVVHPEALNDEAESEGVWCHGIGRLILNPVLSVASEKDGVLGTEFMFRTVWGAYEDADMMCYTERWGRAERRQIEYALANPSTAAASELLRRFVLVGVPDRFLRDRFTVGHASAAPIGMETDPTPA